MFTTGQQSVSTTAVKLVDADSKLPTDVIVSTSGDTYFGDSGVTSSNGFRLGGAGIPQVFTVTVPAGGSLYAVTASGSVVVYYFATATLR